MARRFLRSQPDDRRRVCQRRPCRHALYRAVEPFSGTHTPSTRIDHPWPSRSDAHGRWSSQETGVAIGLEGRAPGGSATVYTVDGRRLLRGAKGDRRLVELQEGMALQTAEIVQLRRRL